MKPTDWIFASTSMAVGLSICALTVYDVLMVQRGMPTISSHIRQICEDHPWGSAVVGCLIGQFVGLVEGAVIAHLFWHV